MLLACWLRARMTEYSTGVLVLDEVMRMDTQRLNLHGFLTMLQIGRAQGKSFSFGFHGFNDLLGRLGKERELAFPGGVRATFAAVCSPPANFVAVLARDAVIHPLASQVLQIALTELEPWPKVYALVVSQPDATHAHPY